MSMSTIKMKQELIDWGVEGDWTVSSALWCTEGYNPQKMSRGRYHHAVIWWLDQIADEDERGRVFVPVGIIQYGWCKFPPRVWAEMAVECTRDWERISPRPDRLGSPYNSEPGQFVSVWAAHHKAEWWGDMLRYLETEALKGRSSAEAISDCFCRLAIGRGIRNARRTRMVLRHYKLAIWLFSNQQPLKVLERGARVRWAAWQVSQEWMQTPGWVKKEKFWEKMAEVMSRPLEERSPKGYWWRKCHRYIPSCKELRTLDVEGIKKFDSKTYLKALRCLEREMLSGASEDVRRGAIAVTRLFGSGWRTGWVDWHKRRGVNAHESTHWLPVDTKDVEGLGAFLKKHREKNTTSLGIIARGWDSLTTTEKAGSFRLALQAAQRQVYEGVPVGARDLAAEAGKWGLSQEEWDRLLLWWEWRNERKEEIPGGILAQDGDWILRRLDREDPRGPFLGHYSGCCQHPTGAAWSCVRATFQEPHMGYWVVEDKRGEIIVQSWVWRTEDVLVVDSVESLRPSDADRILCLYREAAANTIGRLGISLVVGGGQYGVDFEGFEMCGYLGDYAPSWRRVVDGVYTDARGCLALLAGEVPND